MQSVMAHLCFYEPIIENDMKKDICVALCLFFLGTIAVMGQNLALHLDGKDNNVRTGIGFLEAPWTLETWLKGDDASWKETEVVFGGGEYSTYRHADNFPLVVRQGKLYSTRAGIGTSEWLDAEWHHVALTCDGKRTTLYVDGVPEACKDTAVTIIPGAIGVSESGGSVFGGWMDEVRIWGTALSGTTLQQWMGRPLDASHPSFGNLIAYYNFDAGIDDTALNWVGSGYHSYHLRNGRVAYEGKESLAYAALNDNKKFVAYAGRQRLFNAIVIENEWDADRGSKEHQMLKLRIVVQGKENPLQLEKISLDLSETTRLSDLSGIRIYYAGQTARSPQRDLLFASAAKRRIDIDLPSEKQVSLAEGANYILVTADVKERAGLNNKLRVKVPAFTLSGQNVTPTWKEPYIFQYVTDNSHTDSDVFRVLQWNIWHGGRHVPLEGHDRIIELIKASQADIITMQEGYGAQEKIAAALQYHLQTPSPKDNLCLFSRYPLQRQKTGDAFCSNPAIVSFDGKRSLLVDDCWVRYSYNPDYTGSFPDVGHNPAIWVAEDSIRPMADTRRMLDKDLAPILDKQPMPVILGGDFNSCSHLDWTERTARLHGGYGPVSFPTSRFLMERGYKDSFREVHPDESKRPEGTFAGIYGQLDFSRIDFIYYKGKDIRAIHSKIIQTTPEIDDIWPSDHSAVLTTFRWK